MPSSAGPFSCLAETRVVIGDWHWGLQLAPTAWRLYLLERTAEQARALAQDALAVARAAGMAEVYIHVPGASRS